MYTHAFVLPNAHRLCAQDSRHRKVAQAMPGRATRRPDCPELSALALPGPARAPDHRLGTMVGTSPSMPDRHRAGEPEQRSAGLQPLDFSAGYHIGTEIEAIQSARSTRPTSEYWPPTCGTGVRAQNGPICVGRPQASLTTEPPRTAGTCAGKARCIRVVIVLQSVFQPHGRSTSRHDYASLPAAVNVCICRESGGPERRFGCSGSVGPFRPGRRGLWPDRHCRHP